MASLLRLVISNLVTRSFRRPTLVSASRFLTIDAGHRSYTTMPLDDFYDQSRPRILCPKISSMSFNMWMSNYDANDDEDDDDYCSLEVRIPNITTYRLGTKEEPDLYLSLKLPGLEKKDLRACDEHKGGETRKEGNNLRHKSSHDIMEDTKDVMLKTNIMMNILANDIIASFRDISAKRTWAYYDMFSDRSIIVNRFCPILAMLSHINSFSVYKEETAELLYIRMCMPGEQKMKLTAQGLRVSLDMDGVKREDVKTYFDHDDTFFIEGKAEGTHYITGIKLPHGVRKKRNMIERAVEDDVLYAIIPCCENKEENKFN